MNALRWRWWVAAAVALALLALELIALHAATRGLKWLAGADPMALVRAGGVAGRAIARSAARELGVRAVQLASRALPTALGAGGSGAARSAHATARTMVWVWVREARPRQASAGAHGAHQPARLAPAQRAARKLQDLHGACAARARHRDPVAQAHGVAGLDRPAVEEGAPVLDGRDGLGAALVEPQDVERDVETHGSE